MAMPAAISDRDPSVREIDDHLARIGAALRAARESRDEDLNEIAHWLRIRPAFLAALEDGDLRSMPGPVYAAGFLRTYAEHLGLDVSGPSSRQRKSHCCPAPPSMRGRREAKRLWLPDGRMFMAVMVLLGAAISGCYVFLGVDWSPVSRMEAPPSPVSASAAEGIAIAILAAVDDDSGPRVVPAALGSGRVVLVGRTPGWIRLSDPTGDFVRSWAIGPGDWIPIPAQRGLTLSTGDAGSVEILVDGRSVGMAGAAAAVVRDLPLDPDLLLSRLAAS